MKDAAALGSVRDSVAYELMEIAFFYHYARQTAKADEAFAQAARLLGKPGFSPKKDFRAALAALDRGRNRLLELRYFPEMVDVEGGTFVPGCIKPGDCAAEDSLYKATVSDFQMARTETTVWQYNLYSAAMGRSISQRITPAGTLKGGFDLSWGWIGDNPVVYVNWYDAVEYANWASLQQGFKPVYRIVKTEPDTNNLSDYDGYKWIVTMLEGANGYRLPTEAEWEFAARGGTRQAQFKYAGSDDLDEVGWYDSNSGNRTHAVGGKKPNALKLYDLSGNVWEWCWDWYGGYPDGPKKDYRGVDSGYSRVLRGGSWYDYDDDCRPGSRGGINPGYRYLKWGFRLARH